MSALDKAYLVACKAHMGQKDDGGAPYINHPVAVSDMLEKEQHKVVALLHDVAERTTVTMKDLEDAGFEPEVLAAVDALTKRDGEKYGRYIDRVKQNHIAVKVKICDLRHNADLSRYPGATSAQYKKVRKHLKYLIELTDYAKN